MRFAPQSEAEIAESGLWPDGVYDFEVLEAAEKVSKSGNDMIELKVAVFNEAGNRRTVFDYLLESMAYKLRHCAEVCGLLADYEAGRLNADDLVGKTGKLKLRKVPARNGYQAKNDVADYVVAAEPAAPRAERRVPAPAMAGAASDFDDDIPF